MNSQYLVPVTMETIYGWSAAILDYGSEANFDALYEQYGHEIPAGEENCITAHCGHAHRHPQTAERCFGKLMKQRTCWGGWTKNTAEATQ